MKATVLRGFPLSRRRFLSVTLPLAAAPWLSGKQMNLWAPTAGSSSRDFSVCINADIITADPGLLDVLAAAGVNAIWIATYFYGYWPYDKNKIRYAKQLVEQKGMAAFAITIPFGHPGDSLDTGNEAFPLVSPPNWPRTVDINGKVYAGTTLGDIVTTENESALSEIAGMKFSQCMLDDDFRIARLPGVIGGSFDTATRELFMKEGGYAPYQWDELLQNIRERRLTKIVRHWLDGYCNRMTASFRKQQKAFGGELGFMVMYLGAEKAGIRLADYPDINVRVGEAHFDDKALLQPRGWTNELFSVLFHRRYIKPERAWSETTAFPADALSAQNMSAKLVISTIADVRHTIFMSGLSPLPQHYWSTLATAMRTQKSLHEKISGHRLKGPLKHFWGEAARYVGKDNPYSLWLASGIPFEVIETLEQGKDGWIFMSNEDYDHLDAHPENIIFIVREGVKKMNDQVLTVKENLNDIWQWKDTVKAQLKKDKIPYIAEHHPAVCAWYPQPGFVLVWNLAPGPAALTLVYGNRRITRQYQAMESVLIKL